MPKTLFSATKLSVPGLGPSAAHVVPLEAAPTPGVECVVVLDPPAPGLVVSVVDTSRGPCLRFAPKSALTEGVTFKSVKVVEE